jgi:hypothetical protein
VSTTPQFFALARRVAERAIADADRLQRGRYTRDLARIRRLCRGAEINDPRMIVPVLAAALKAALTEAAGVPTIDAMKRIAEIREVLAAELDQEPATDLAA